MSNLRAFLASNSPYFTFICLGAITFLSLYPVEFPEIPGKDKTGHFVAYAACILPVAFAQHKALWKLALALFIWSGAMELIQPYVNRHGDWMDLLANGTGILIGIVLGWLFSKIWKAS